MVDALVAALAILLWLVTLVNGFAHLRTGAVTRAWLVGIFAMLAVASSLCVTAVTAWIAQASGIRSMADAIERTAVMAACFCAQSLLRHVRAPEQTQFAWHTGRLRSLLVALVVLWLAFIVGNVRGSEVYGSFARPEPWPAIYLTVFLGYVAYVLGDVMIGCWHYAGSAGGALGVGLRLMATGCGCALVYAAFKVAALALVGLGPGMPVLVEATMGRALVVLAGVLVAVGALLPAIVRRWQVARSQVVAQLFCTRAVVSVVGSPDLRSHPALPWSQPAAGYRIVCEFEIWTCGSTVESSRSATAGWNCASSSRHRWWRRAGSWP